METHVISHDKSHTATSHKTVLYVENVTVNFEGFRALNGLSVAIDEGALHCIIGPNGAGKTTMLDVITGKTRPDEGAAFLGQKTNLTTMSEAEIVQAGIGRKFQKPTVFEQHTLFENLELSLKAPKDIWHSLWWNLTTVQRERIAEVLRLIGLTEHHNQRAGALSHGQKQWLEIGMLLMQDPQILLLDEPVAGMTPREIEHSTELLTSLAGPHTVVVIEHDMDFVRAIAQRVTVLHEGRVLSEGSMERVQNDPKVIQVYLGEPHA